MATALKTDHEPQPVEAPPAPAAPRRATPAGGRRKFVLPILAVVALLALVWAVRKWTYGRSHESTDNAQVDGHIIPVLAKVGGYVVAVNVSDNQHVAEGALLAQIDSTEYRVRLAQAEAELAAAQAAAGSGPGTGQAEAQVAAAGQQRDLRAQEAVGDPTIPAAHEDQVHKRDVGDKPQPGARTSEQEASDAPPEEPNGAPPEEAPAVETPPEQAPSTEEPTP
jgi:membrane fusion protein (multidrug efflux system)